MSTGTRCERWSRSLPPGLRLVPSATVRTRLVVALSCIVVAAVATGGASAFAVNEFPPPPDGAVGIAYSYVFTPKDGAAPYAFFFKGGDLPPGLKIQEDGTFSGTPTQPGTFNFDVEATQYCGCPTQRSFTVEVRDRLTITTPSLKSATVGVPYSAPVAVTGNGGLGMGWKISAGSVPAGMTIAADGSPGDTTLSGTPTTVGMSTFTVKVGDTDGYLPDRSTTKQLTLAVVAPLAAAAAGTLPTGIVGRLLSVTPATATGGLAPHSWSLAGGTLPPGLALDPATGALAGSPTAAGSFSFSLRVADVDGRTATADAAITVVQALDLVTTRLRAATVDDSYRAALLTRGGQGPRTFAVTGGKLPPGLKLNAQTGVISGRPKAAGTFRFRITVRDALGQRSSERLTLSVRR